jgi:hypothetical protein
MGVIAMSRRRRSNLRIREWCIVNGEWGIPLRFAHYVAQSFKLKVESKNNVPLNTQSTEEIKKSLPFFARLRYTLGVPLRSREGFRER